MSLGQRTAQTVRRKTWFRARNRSGKLLSIVKHLPGILSFILVVWFGVAPLGAAEYYRWVDDNGVLHITDNLHDVPPKQREGVNRIQTRETPRAPAPEIKPAPRKASIPFEAKARRKENPKDKCIQVSRQGRLYHVCPVQVTGIFARFMKETRRLRRFLLITAKLSFGAQWLYKVKSV